MKPIEMSSVLGQLQALRQELGSGLDETRFGGAHSVDFAAVLRLGAGYAEAQLARLDDLGVTVETAP